MQRRLEIGERVTRRGRRLWGGSEDLEPAMHSALARVSAVPDTVRIAQGSTQFRVRSAGSSGIGCPAGLVEASCHSMEGVNGQRSIGRGEAHDHAASCRATNEGEGVAQQGPQVGKCGRTYLRATLLASITLACL